MLLKSLGIDKNTSTNVMNTKEDHVTVNIRN